ncbi:unnamed protein product, partial [marine sediment metagenome]
ALKKYNQDIDKIHQNSLNIGGLLSDAKDALADLDLQQDYLAFDQECKRKDNKD